MINLQYMPVVSRSEEMRLEEDGESGRSMTEEIVESFYPIIAGGACVSMMIVLARIAGWI